MTAQLNPNTDSGNNNDRDDDSDNDKSVDSQEDISDLIKAPKVTSFAAMTNELKRSRLPSSFTTQQSKRK